MGYYIGGEGKKQDFKKLKKLVGDIKKEINFINPSSFF
jgi:hypothetical protein